MTHILKETGTRLIFILQQYNSMISTSFVVQLAWIKSDFQAFNIHLQYSPVDRKEIPHDLLWHMTRILKETGTPLIFILQQYNSTISISFVVQLAWIKYNTFVMSIFVQVRCIKSYITFTSTLVQLVVIKFS